MAGTMQNLTHAAERQAISVMLDGFLKHLKSQDDRTKTYVQIVDLAEKFWGSGANRETIAKVREYVQNPDNRWMRFINRVVDETDPHYAKTMLLNLGYEAFLRGTKQIRQNREKYGCNIPWLILFDPTDACNMHCVGCWSGTYGHKANLTFEDMDKIVTQGKELGVYLYMMTGGEPLVRKKDILSCARSTMTAFRGFYQLHADRRGTSARRWSLGNLTFMLSIEGTPETNDARRGEGHYEAVMKAMDLLKKYGIVYGTSICYTSQNVEAVTSDEFLRLHRRQGRALRLLLPLYAGRQQRGSVPDADGRAAQEDDRQDPLCPLRQVRHRLLPDGLPERRRVCRRLHRRRTELLPHQLRTATRSPACSSITRIPTSTTTRSWRCCRARCSWHTMKDSRSTATICVPARCWRIRSCCVRWSRRPARTAPTPSRRRTSSICARKCDDYAKDGRRWPRKIWAQPEAQEAFL